MFLHSPAYSQHTKNKQLALFDEIQQQVEQVEIHHTWCTTFALVTVSFVNIMEQCFFMFVCVHVYVRMCTRVFLFLLASCSLVAVPPVEVSQLEVKSLLCQVYN